MKSKELKNIYIIDADFNFNEINFKIGTLYLIFIKIWILNGWFYSLHYFVNG